VLTGRSVDLYNPKVVRSTTGSLFHLPITVDVELENVVPLVRDAGLQLIAADIKGEDLVLARSAGVLDLPTAWLFGNEARGLTNEHLALAEKAISVPIYGDAESMNLATAAAVCIYESAFAHHAL
jgi:TrmH family RNA methyltransferase